MADLIIVMAKPVKRPPNLDAPLMKSRIHRRDQHTGFEVLHRCRFMGIRAIENGLLRFNDMKILLKISSGAEAVDSSALATLNDDG